MPARIDDDDLLTDSSTKLVIDAITQGHQAIKDIQDYTGLSRSIINSRLKRLTTMGYLTITQTSLGNLQPTNIYSLVSATTSASTPTSATPKPKQLETLEEKVWFVLNELTKEVAELKHRIESLPSANPSFDVDSLMDNLNS